MLLNSDVDQPLIASLWTGVCRLAARDSRSFLTIGSGAFLDVLHNNTEQAIGLLISHLANLLKAFTLWFETVKL